MNFLSGFLIFLLTIVIGLYIYVAIDIPKRKFKNEKERINWLLLIFLLPLLGSIYYLIKRNKKGQ